MNPFLVAGALLTFLTLLIHVFLGGPEILPLGMDSSLPSEWKALFIVIWHAVTTVLLVSSVALGVAATGRHTTPLVLMVSAQFLGFAALFIYFGATILGTLWPLPQWIIFIGITAVVLVPLLRKPQQSAT